MSEKMDQRFRDRFYQLIRNKEWGTCSGCPIENGLTFPEQCQFFYRADHKIDGIALLEYYERHPEEMVSK